jgi:hypothetical protein
VSDLPYQPGQTITAGVLYRRIPNYSSLYLYSDRRPTNAAFRVKREDEYLSMSLKDLTTVGEMLRGHDGFGLCEIDASDLVRLGLDVTYEPEPEDRAHVAVRGVTKSLRGKMALIARVVVEPGPPAE